MQKKSALLVVSFGTAYPEAGKKTIGMIERGLASAFIHRTMYSAWTSRRIVQKLKKTHGISRDTLPEALERMHKQGVADVLIQPTYMLDGTENENMLHTVRNYRERFDTVAVGSPLLNSRSDVRELATALERLLSGIPSSESVVFMGHGSTQMKLPVYDILNKMFKEDGFAHFIVGTVEHEPGFLPVLDHVQSRLPDKVILTPLLVTAGNHALYDMIGEHDGSWKAQLEKAGVETKCSLKGLGEYREIRELYIRRAKEAESKVLR
ncbi:MAG: sirohydrochlorin cobaltochelatase [Clostridia bacterium]|nr:sirohydrochlorin cobaltochelatase [Clostridia bacterium]